MKNIEFDSVSFDLEDKTFTVKNGSIGTYSYKDVLQCNIKNEDAKFKGKTKPFTHCVLYSPGQNCGFLERSIYTGLKLTMRDRQVLAIYVSKERTTLNTDLYRKDQEEAKKIQRLFEKAIHKYAK